ncbi:MAG: tetratricopeptide repeat protein [Pyrinomonadaceae bacterium]
MKARILFSSLVVFVCAASVEAQFGINTISGSVFNEARRPVGQTWVELMTEYNSFVQRVQTNQSGHYTFTRVPYNKYVVRVKPLETDLEEQEIPVELYNQSGDARRQMPMYQQVDFYLTRRRRGNGFPQMNGVIFAQDVPKEARDLYTSISESDGSDVAVQKLESAVKIFPRYHDALLQLGTIYIQKEKYAEAENVFFTVVDVNPQGFGGWYGLGHAQFSLNKPASLLSLQKAVDMDKGSINAWYMLGLAQRKSKNYEESRTALLQARKLDEGKTPDISWNLALLYYYNLKKPLEAAAELDHYLKINKDSKNKDQVRTLIAKMRSSEPYGNGK